jgi:hypothetical protein
MLWIFGCCSVVGQAALAVVPFGVLVVWEDLIPGE